MKRICVYCGSRTGSLPVFSKAARALALTLVSNRYGLVYGGGNVGLMGILANEVLQHGGEVMGIIPELLMDKELGLTEVTEMKVVGSMHERKKAMADAADGFIALPGGIGTLEELFEILTWGYLGLHTKPCGLLNTAGFFDPLIDFLSQVETQGFLHQPIRNFLIVESTPDRLLTQMEALPTPQVEVVIEKPSQT